MTHPSDPWKAFLAAHADLVPLPPSDKPAGLSSTSLLATSRRAPQTPSTFELKASAAFSDPLDFNLPADAEVPTTFRRNGIDALTLKRLRRGDWPIEDELDLHGMTIDRARTALAAFLDAAQLQALRCVRVIHGKGLSSETGVARLKICVRHWLTQSAVVLAFAQPTEREGGGGAVWVLLRSNTRSAPGPIAKNAK